MLQQMTRMVEKEKPDAYVISGDVYDTMQPSASVQTMLANALVDIHRANPDMKILCIAGNHDSGSRHTIYRTPWKALGVEMVGNISRDSRLEDYIFKVEGKGYIVAKILHIFGKTKHKIIIFWNKLHNTYDLIFLISTAPRHSIIDPRLIHTI